ncbi:uncharacterized protein EV154DRAFT_494222 [Mucor mucedo]|uniref:uncharacterized protein n=1 Tax=Mucor mucedo TaxID=29922 RepID=UPI0022207BFC|nr:uncharacterized protein EV154DRAFT_494222 [Mucor mucedo]KAI7895929.1 hypothetical protein EV154DRAFT_494222 [Mucor mucedo]
MDKTNKQGFTWSKEHEEAILEAVAREVEIFNEMDRENMKWFAECATISQILAWGEKHQILEKYAEAERDQHISEFSESKSTTKTEMCRKNYGITPEDFVEKIVPEEISSNKPVFQEDSGTETGEFIGAVSSNEIRDIAEEREIQLAPEFDSILNYDPKEAGDIGDTKELVNDVNTQSELQGSSIELEQVVKREMDDEILLFVSSRKSGEHAVKSPIKRGPEKVITKDFIQTSLNNSLTNINPISSEKTNTLPNPITKKQQHANTSPIQYNDKSPSRPLINVKSDNENIPINESKITQSNAPPLKPVITMDIQHKSITSLETTAIYEPVVNNSIRMTPTTSNYAKTMKTNDKTDPDDISVSKNLKPNASVSEHASYDTSNKRPFNSLVEVKSTIEVSEVMPQKPFRKKLRLANPQKVCRV